MNPSGTDFLNIRGFMNTAVFSNVAHFYNEISSKLMPLYLLTSFKMICTLASLITYHLSLSALLWLDYHRLHDGQRARLMPNKLGG